MRKFYKNWDQKFVSRYVYMGYLTPEVAQKYMEKLMIKLLLKNQKFINKMIMEKVNI